MRRTVLSAMALACTAVLASTAPAFADGPSPAPTAHPTRPPATTDPAPTAEPTRPPATTGPTPAPAESQVSVVPSGAPDTGVMAASKRSGTDDGVIGGAAAAVLGVGGAAFFVVRRRRATGA
ncbi:sortase-dependent protein [Streptomyces sp. NPDC059866]|uniref:sortase-dependent protein n=1 Tax=Streptomyces sp. NPDC059866 TaxID=3346978 RepID=UPI003659D258